MRKMTFVCAAFLAWAAAAAPAKKPNVVIIMADDLGYGDVSCNGATRVATPNIDRLAREGRRFPSGYCSASTCTPTRYSLITGTYAFRRKGTGIAPPNGPALIKPGTETIATLMKKAGYATTIIGKWHLGLGVGKPDWNGELNPGPLEIGFDSCLLLPTTNDRVPQVFVENHRVRNLDPKDPLWVGDKPPTPDYVDGRNKEARKKLKMNWCNGHDGTIHNGISRIGYYTGGTAARFRDEDLADEWVKTARAFLAKNKNNPFFMMVMGHDIHVPRVPHERFKGKSPMGPRGDMILEFDWVVGEVVRAIEEQGLAKDTLVFVLSDNGPAVNDGYADDAAKLLGGHRPAGPFKGGKYTIWEGGTRVPFITYWPGTIQPGVSDEVVCTIDLAASLAKLVGAPIAPDGCLDSQDVMDALLAKPGAKGRASLVEQDNNGAKLALREGDWKAVRMGRARRRGKKAAQQPAALLYNLKDDPGETTDLSQKHPEKLKELLAKLDDLIAKGRTRPAK